MKILGIDFTLQELLMTIGLFVVVGILVVTVSPYSDSQMKNKKNALIEDSYRKKFKK